MIQSEFNSLLRRLVFLTSIQLSDFTLGCSRLLLILNCTASSPTLSVNSHFYTSIKADLVAKKGLPSNKGTWVSFSIFMTTKSTRNTNFPTLTSTSSRMPSGCAIDLSAIYNVIAVGVSSPKLSRCTTDRGIKFILAPKSNKAFLNSYFPMEQGMVKLQGSFIFVGSFYWIMAQKVAVKFTIPSSAIFLFSLSTSFINFA